MTTTAVFFNTLWQYAISRGGHLLRPDADRRLVASITRSFRPGIPSFEEVEQRVNEILYNQKMQPALRVYLTTLRKESYIFVAPGYVDSGAERPSETVLAKKGE